MANEMFTQLPSVTSSTMADIICAVQAGVSVQETLGQIFTLFSNGVVLNYPGNPNGNLAGTTFQLCWDTTDKVLWTCTTSGSVSTAVWTISIYNGATNGQIAIGSTTHTPVLGTIQGTGGISVVNGPGSIVISGNGTYLGWNNITSSSQQMITNAGYVADKSTLVTFTLPTTASFGDVLEVIGIGAGGWSIILNSGQSINVGSVATTTTTGSVSSTNQFDSICLICTTANTTWTTRGGVQGNLTIV